MSNTGEEWIFTPDIDEIHYEYEYDGVERSFSVKYLKVEKPKKNSSWQADTWYPTFRTLPFVNMFRKIGEGSDDTQLSQISEPGEYLLTAFPDVKINRYFNFRVIRLYVTIV